MAFDIYYAVVARWNARVQAEGAEARHPLLEYLSYLINVYARLDGLERDIEPEELARVEESWPLALNAVLDPAAVQMDAGAGTRRHYLLGVQGIIESFFPGFPPYQPTDPAEMKSIATNRERV
jgi:hypothetical protein